mmetsp:Transcript_78264/g.153622  ORF Transcript_78264/g.153622 Transcript_78264/m.153622 type:complete len:293 (-) Transcript_78264:70-948(-)
MADEISDQQKTDEAILQQMQDINQNIVDNQPLIAEAATINDALRGEYINNTDSPGFLPGLDYLNEKYARIRRVRGDGNCFYRSMLFAYLENLILRLQPGNEHPIQPALALNEYERMLHIIRRSKDDLVAVGYDEFAVESFYDTFLEFIEKIPTMTTSTLLEQFLEGGEAEYYTWYMRLLTAGYLRKHEERFFPFVDSGLDVDMAGYCRREVEPMGRECEQIHVIALTEYLGLRVAIEYLDGREFDPAVGLGCIEFPQSDEGEQKEGGAAGLCYFVVQLLYRPGHYDILYSSV